MQADRLDPQDAPTSPAAPSDVSRRLKSRVGRAMKRGDWALIERLADTRNLRRARAVGQRLARALPAEEARLDAWLDGPKAPAAIFAFARQARDASEFFALVGRIHRAQPGVVERLMPRRWAAEPETCLKYVKVLCDDLASLRPYPSRAIRALLAGCEAVPSRELLLMLAEIRPERAAKTRELVASVAGLELVGPRTEGTAGILIEWLGRPGLRKVARDAVRAARSVVAQYPERGLREKLVALRDCPELAPLL